MISIIVPVYNESTAVAGFNEKLQKEMDGVCYPWEVIYVNDGSSDDSGEILKKLANAKIFSHEINLGYGAAVKTGVANSKYKMIGIIDCDDTYEPRDLKILIEKIENYDMVVGARKPQGGLRWFSKRILRFVASFAVSFPIPDLNSGLRVFRRSFFDKVVHLLPNGFSLTTTITLCSFYYGYRLLYIPIDYSKRNGKSKIRPIRDFTNFSILIFRIMLLFNPMRFFLPPSMVMGLIGGAFLIRDVLALNVAQTSLLMLTNGAVLFAIGLLAEAIRWKR